MTLKAGQLGDDNYVTTPTQKEYIITEGQLEALAAGCQNDYGDWCKGVDESFIETIRSRHTYSPQSPAKFEGIIPCPKCGAPTWYQLADGKPTLFCYSATCRWKQAIEKDHDTTIIAKAKAEERERVLNDLLKIIKTHGFSTGHIPIPYEYVFNWTESLRKGEQ